MALICAACDPSELFNDTASAPAQFDLIQVPDSAARTDTLKIVYSWSYTACDRVESYDTYLDHGTQGRPLYTVLSVYTEIQSLTQPAPNCHDTRFTKLDSVYIPPTRDTLFKAIFYGQPPITRLERDYPHTDLGPAR